MLELPSGTHQKRRSRDDVNILVDKHHDSQNPYEPQEVGHKCIVAL